MWRSQTLKIQKANVIEAYHNPLYTNGGNEEVSVNLITFAKTDLLDPGQSQTLTLEICGGGHGLL